MSRYVWVNPERLKKGRLRNQCEGVDLIVEVSPYSKPVSVIGDYDRVGGKFLIQFRYIDNEPNAPRPTESNGVVIVEGRYSGKILSIALPIDGPELKTVGIISLKTRIKNALKARSQASEQRKKSEVPVDQLNQDIAEEIIEKDLEVLAGELAM
jgi:hypothetical protein